MYFRVCWVYLRSICAVGIVKFGVSKMKIKLDRNGILPISLFLIMFSAKIFGYFNASWWVVCLPLTLPFMALVFILVVMFVVSIVIEIL